MPYPAAPWQLKGQCLQTLHWVDMAAAQPLIPEDFELISVLPGKTLGGVYLATYGTGSTLDYNELIITPGLVRYGNELGAWISHIYVDNPDSQAGGREIWGLPKELADFNWRGDGVDVSRVGQTFCSLTYQEGWLSFVNNIPGKLTGTVFSQLQGNILQFKGKFGTRSQIVDGQLTVSPDSPFTSLNLGQPWMTLHSKTLDLIAEAPTVVGQVGQSGEQPLQVAV
ncbi:MAG: acetoacetate decarboxylase family protein [Cyanobacteria bacterium P01_F01_bin.4]